MKTALQIVYTLLCIIIGFFFGGQTERNKIKQPKSVDYTIEFLSPQGLTKITSSSGDIYVVSFEKIEETLEKDNL
jgi:hypothetical protein